MLRDCPKGFRVCFSCNQMGHMNVDCPQLASRAVQNLAPTTVRITNGHQAKVEASRSRGRAFQLTVEEAHTDLDVVAGMCSLFFYFHYVAYIIDYVGTFLVNYMPALMLFDSGVSPSFLSSSFCCGFSIP